MASDFRLTPTRANRKLLALRFIKEHFAETGHSPSLGEIGAALGVTRQSAHEIVRALDADGSIIRKPGNRGILLPDPALMISRSDALLMLKAFGWQVDVGAAMLGWPANDTIPLTDSGLPMLPSLDHIPDIEFGGMRDDDDNAGERRQI